MQDGTHPGAFGNGNCILTDILSMLPWISMATSVVVGATVAAISSYQGCKAK
ncbi:MAG: hypothetical protein M3270_11705 [Thermoproteota archaeon]|nr:hypothetical protein [Thermoproteota archaeon]